MIFVFESAILPVFESFLKKVLEKCEKTDTPKTLVV